MLFTRFFSFRCNDAVVEGFKNVTKSIFDFAVNSLKNRSVLPIQELIIDGFDEEQIWQVRTTN